jgi:hypothetical protein
MYTIHIISTLQGHFALTSLTLQLGQIELCRKNPNFVKSTYCSPNLIKYPHEGQAFILEFFNKMPKPIAANIIMPDQRFPNIINVNARKKTLIRVDILPYFRHHRAALYFLQVWLTKPIIKATKPMSAEIPMLIIINKEKYFSIPELPIDFLYHHLL